MSIAQFKIFLVLLFIGASQSFAKPNACYKFYSTATFRAEANNLEKYLSGPLGTSNEPTVKATENRGNKVIFVKNKDGMWVSKHNAVPETLTAEGDIRLPIFLLGTELAAKLGYAIREIGDNKIEIQVPDADMLASKIATINESLKSRGLEPITYLPIRAGFVTIKETIQMILSAKGDYLVHFPYADKDLVLVSHEVSFHLGSILLNKKIVSRARTLTEEFQSFIDLIDQNKDRLGPQATRLKGQLRIERNFEMDAGLASMVTSPGFTRRDGGMKPYSELYPRISGRYCQYMLRNVEFLARPRLQPHEAVLTHLELITGLKTKDLVHNDPVDFKTMILPEARVGTKVEMGSQELKVLRELAETFAARKRPLHETGTPEVWLDGFLKNLDQRLQDISEGLD